MTFLLILLQCQFDIARTMKLSEEHDLQFWPSPRLSIVSSSPSYLFPTQLQSPRDMSITIVILLNDGKSDDLKLLLNSLMNINNPNKIRVNLQFSINKVASKDKIQIANTFVWPHGASKVTKNSVDNPWNPTTKNEYGLVLQDDSSAVSPNCIIWLETILNKIVSDDSKTSDRIIGISVALSLAPNVVATANSLPVAKNNKNIPVLYQAAAMSGVLYFPDSWRVLNDKKQELNSFDRNRKNNIRGANELESLDRFILEFMSKNGLFVVYPNFQHVAASTYVIPSDADALQSVTSAQLDEFPIFDAKNNPILGRNQLIDAINWIESSADDGMNAKKDSSSDGMWVSSLNVSFFQQPVISQQLASKQYRENVCNAFSKLHESNRILADPRHITIMISTMHRFPIVLQQILYYSKSPIVSTIIVTWHNMRVPAPKTVVIGKTIVYFVVPTSDSLNNRFLPDDRINTAAVLIIDDDMKVHLDDLQVLHAVWSRHSNHIVGFSPRWFKALKTLIPRLEYTYNKFKFGPKTNDEVTNYNNPTEYGIMLTKVMMMRNSYLYEYTCGWMNRNNEKIAENDHSKLLDSVTEMRNCEDIFMNGIIANNVFGSTESPALFVSPLHNVGDFGTSGSKFKALHLAKASSTSTTAAKPKPWLDLRSECLNTMDSVIRKYSKNRLQLQTYLFLSSQNSNLINFELSRKSYDKYFTFNCDSEKAKALNDPSCAWSDDRNFTNQILLTNFA